MPRFNPARGGHAPGHLRDWFNELVNDECDDFNRPPLSLRRLCGLLWNCTDVMPSSLRDEVRGQYDNWELYPEPMTYAQGARMIRRSQSD